MPTLLTEVGSVLARDRLRRFISVDGALKFVSDLAALTTLVADPPRPYAEISGDPDDDYLLALAAENNVAVLGSGDKDLLELPPTTTRIVSPRTLAEELV